MDQERVDQIARLLAASEAAQESGAESAAQAEATLPPKATPVRPRDLLDRVDSNMSKAPLAGSADWNQARDLALGQAGEALDKLKRGERQLTPDQQVAMEAVIIGDGTRPSFVLSDGSYDPADPFIGTWGGELATAEANGLRRLARAVGRIQPKHGNASNYFGTGSLVDDQAGLVLTNYHVIDDAENRGVPMTRTADRIRVDGHLEIDFDAERDSLTSNSFRIVEVLLPSGYGRVFDGYDVVVARVDLSGGGQALPAAVARLSAAPRYATGTMSSLAVIGFPATPVELDGQNIDWDFVLRTLFGNTFGVKRLAPGRFTRSLGSHPHDAQAKRAIGHDASTFGGASGALLASWLDSEAPCFAIHFGGATEAANYALSFAVAREAMESLGVPF